jgi:superfamily II DNA or RNA helicase
MDKGIGFCVTIQHGRCMAQMFKERGITAAALVSGVDEDKRAAMLSEFRTGRLKFLNLAVQVPERLQTFASEAGLADQGPV